MARRRRGRRSWSWRRTVRKRRRRSAASRGLPRRAGDNGRAVGPRISDPSPAAGDPVPADRADVLASRRWHPAGREWYVETQAGDQAVNEARSRSGLRDIRGAAPGTVADHRRRDAFLLFGEVPPRVPGVTGG